MTKQEAINNIKAALPNAHAFKEELDVLENKPKKVKYRVEYLGVCPNCDSHVKQFYHHYCPECGQALDWSGE